MRPEASLQLRARAARLQVVEAENRARFSAWGIQKALTDARLALERAEELCALALADGGRAA